jgi:hypothetical protein
MVHRARRRVVFALVLGIVTTLLLSWPIPLALLRWGWNEHMHGTMHPWTSPSGVFCGVQVSRLPLSDWFIVRPIRPESSRIPVGEPARVPDWVAFPAAKDPNLFNIDTAATGWPFRTLASESWLYWQPPPAAPAYRESLRWNLVLLSTVRGRIILPLRPIVPGLVADIAVFAAAWWLLAAAVSFVRAAGRRSRGRCVACGYDLVSAPRDLPCPECGHIPGPKSAAIHASP